MFCIVCVCACVRVFVCMRVAACIERERAIKICLKSKEGKESEHKGRAILHPCGGKNQCEVSACERASAVEEISDRRSFVVSLPLLLSYLTLVEEMGEDTRE